MPFVLLFFFFSGLLCHYWISSESLNFRIIFPSSVKNAVSTSIVILLHLCHFWYCENIDSSFPRMGAMFLFANVFFNLLSEYHNFHYRTLSFSLLGWFQVFNFLIEATENKSISRFSSCWFHCWCKGTLLFFVYWFHISCFAEFFISSIFYLPVEIFESSFLKNQVVCK